jgi:hypothetical protein
MKKRWTWNGHELAHPVTIARRLIAMPFIVLLRVLLFGAIWLGWGIEDAVDNWRISA